MSSRAGDAHRCIVLVGDGAPGCDTPSGSDCYVRYRLMHREVHACVLQVPPITPAPPSLLRALSNRSQRVIKSLLDASRGSLRTPSTIVHQDVSLTDAVWGPQTHIQHGQHAGDDDSEIDDTSPSPGTHVLPDSAVGHYCHNGIFDTFATPPPRRLRPGPCTRFSHILGLRSHSPFPYIPVAFSDHGHTQHCPPLA